MWYALMNVCLLLLCIRRIMHLSMFYVIVFIFQHYIHVHVHGAICSEFFDGLVASSSLVTGSGMLQYGVRAKVATWAWMGHEDAVTKLMLQQLGLRGPWKDQLTEVGCLLPRRNQEEMGEWQEKFIKFSKFQNYRLIEKLSEKFFRCSGRASMKVTRRGKNSLGFGKFSKCLAIGTLKNLDRWTYDVNPGGGEIS